MSKKHSVVVIDDNEGFLDQIRNDLSSEFDILCIQSEEEIEHISTSIKQHNPDHLLIDHNLHKPSYSQDLLRYLTSNALGRHCKVWLISQSPPDKLDSFYEINSNIQPFSLTKPLHGRSLRQQLFSEEIYIPKGDLEEGVLGDNFPLPVRILTEGGAIAYHNKLWKNPDYPPPENNYREIIERLLKKDNDALTVVKYGDPFNGTAYSYKLHHFLLREDDINFIGQMVETLKPQELPKNLQDNLADIYAFMAGTGYSRGRFFHIKRLVQHEINQAEWILELDPKNISGNHNNEIFSELKNSIHRTPIIGTLEKRLAEYGEDQNQEKIGFLTRKPIKRYRVRDWNDTEETGDRYIRELNKVLYHNQRPPVNWLELPIWIPDNRSLQSPPKLRLAGLLIFDRITEDSHTYGDDEVDESHVDSAQPLLRNIANQLEHKLTQHYQEELISYEKAMRNLDKKLSHDQSDKKRYRLILEHLCHKDITGASSAVMGITSQHGEYLNIVDAYTPNEETDFLKDTIIDLKLSKHYRYHPIVEIWVNEEDFLAYQTFDIGCPAYRRLIEALKLEKTYPGNAEKKEKFHQWINTHVKSVLCIPVKLGGSKERIGAISLHFDKPYAITGKVFDHVRALLQRVRWVMLYAQQKSSQMYQISWEQTLGHDLKSTVNQAWHQLHIYQDENPEMKSATLKSIEKHLIDATDLANNWMDLNRKDLNISIDESNRTLSGDAIFDYIGLSEKRINNNYLKINLSPEKENPVWQQAILNTSQKHYERVIRIILDNAFKYGRRYCNEIYDDSSFAEIEIEASTSSTYWKLVIRNPADISTLEEDYAFSAETPFTLRHPGTHIGLYNAKRWVDFVNGKIQLRSHNKKASLTLEWPVFPR